jgi:alanine-synthesizing transaminase
VFSSRLEWNAHPNPLSTLLSEKRAEGAAILDLTESNPTRAALDYPREALLSALADPRALSYDPDPRGLLSAREAVSQYYAQRRVEVPASSILLTASTSEAYSYLFKLLTNPGDEILVPRPSYPLFDYLAAMECVAVRQYPLRYDGLWHLAFPALADAITTRTRAIVVVTPNNPTGSYLKRTEWEHLQALGLTILSDEVFSDFAFSPDPEYIPTLAGQNSVLTFSMSGLSKIAGLPQMKLGWIVASGPDHPAALDGLEWIVDTYLSVSTPVQLALPRLLTATRPVQEQIRAQTRSNLEHLRENLLSSASPCRCLTVEGGWYAVLEVPRIRTEEEWVLQLLAEKDVLVQPGFFYDFEAEAFLVLSLLTPPALFAEGLRRILESTGSHS